MTPAQAYKAALEAAAKWHDDQVIPLKEEHKELEAHLGYTSGVYEKQAWISQSIVKHKFAAAAIRALPVPQDAGDMVLVPREPTWAMQLAGDKAAGVFAPSCADIYRAMIEAKEKP